MGTQDAFAVVTDWLVALGVASLVVAVYVSWLASYRTPKVAPVGSSRWFAMPSWAQIVAGLVVTIIGAYLCYLLWIPLPLSLSSEMSLFLRIVGLLSIGGGIALWFWARQALGGMMGVSTASAAQLRIHHQLIKSGPYAIVRHPMYVGYWLVLTGLVSIYRTWTPVILLIMMLISLSKRARREDRVLEAAFGDDWRHYAEDVPMFVRRWK
ncbi:MAG: isoprenylcysteine carboxylmethyltransferase family protein [Anaerolineae bacterium]|nr:isoprenylcysteine carboxylmethyltransferase family protein [Anaerolineae bacterium]